MTIKNLYPKARPQTIYNVINGRPELPAASTFSRASEATYVDAGGNVRTAAVDEPRFNYDPETGELLGLLLENEGVNLNQYSSDPEAYSLANPTAWGPIADEFNQLDPLGGTNAVKLTVDYDNQAYWRTLSSTGNIESNTEYWVSVFVKQPDDGTDEISFQFDQNNFQGPRSFFYYTFSTNELSTQGGTTTFLDQVVQKYPTGWVRLGVKIRSNSFTASNPRFVFMCRPANAEAGIQTYIVYGPSVEKSTLNLSSYIPVSDGDTTGAAREPDAFSLTTTSNFDGGFSLLLDSETTTDDYFYKVKASGVTIAELNNASGTLDWVINGQSAATNGEYPQVGAIQPGRVRTVSSFGAADGTTQVNYLYTYGLSFPTNAIVAPGADELEFGIPQTLKAVYLWNGQLSNTEAVSVIKGEYNVVPSEPIKADSYSFVYDTDPTTIGETSITLPYIVPTVSMRVYWGDGTSSAYEQGVTPSHTYPYPGQYRIQIEADDGFDAVRLGLSYSIVITRVDQWPPQFRENATGPGFTGDQAKELLVGQKAFGGTIPKFKYTDLTSLKSTFANVTGQRTAVSLGPWDYIPTNIPLVTTLESAFSALGRYDVAASPDRTNFPTLTTSSALVNVSSCFANTKMVNFVNDRPFTDTSGVTNWRNCFSGASLTSVIVDTSAGTNLSSMFARNNFVVSPSIDTSSATDISYIITNNTNLTTQLAWDTSSATNLGNAWEGCSNLTSFPLIDTSNGTNFYKAWYGCSALTTFPQLNTSSGENFINTWHTCTNLTSFPQIDTSSATDFSYGWTDCVNLTSFPTLDTSSASNLSGAWQGCSGLTSFPLIVITNAKQLGYAWKGCRNLTTFPLLDTSSVESMGSTWRGCSGLTSFPLLNTSSVTNLTNTWYGCSNLTTFPLLDTSSATTFNTAWKNCTVLTSFPANMFDTTGTLASSAFANTWTNCDLTAQSIENILVSLDTNGASNITLSVDGGTNAGQSTWTAAANTAYTNLINKGWAITARP